MVGTRVAPDNNDIVVWKLDDAGTPFVNSSTSSSAVSHANSDLNTLSGTVNLRQPSLFAATGTNSCVQFSGNNSSSPRNFIAGGNNTLPQPPLTVSYWLYLRTYNSSGSTQVYGMKQTTTNVWSGTTFAALGIQNRQANSQPSQNDFFVITNSNNNGGDITTPVEFPIPLNTWSHIGMTYDGTAVLAYVNGNNIGSAVASPTGNIFYSGTPGPWFFGAIPTASGNPEEGCYSICDYRIANVVRPQSYFANIYQNGVLNTGLSVVTIYYKMRAFDLYYTTTPLYWTDTSISYANAPASPSGWGLGPIEVMDTWNALNV